MGVSDLLVNLLSAHFGAPTHPPNPKVLGVEEHTPTPSPFIVFTFGFVVRSKSLEVHHIKTLSPKVGSQLGVATLALARDQGKGVARLRAYK